MKKFIIIALALAVFGLVCGYVYGSNFEKPEYISSSRLMVRNPKTTNQAKDYASIATSRSVLTYAQTEIGLAEDIEELKDYIVATNLVGTNIIDISVTTDSAEKSNRINHAIVDGVKIQADLLYEVNNIVDVDTASEASQTSSPQPVVRSFMGAAVGLLLGMLIGFIFYPTRTENASESVKETSEPQLHKATPENSKQLLKAQPINVGLNRQKVMTETQKKSVHRSTSLQSQPKENSEEDRDLDEILMSLENKRRR